jgi:hypothetical protein
MRGICAALRVGNAASDLMCSRSWISDTTSGMPPGALACWRRPQDGDFYFGCAAGAVGSSIDWVFVLRVWPDGADRLRSLLAADLGHGIAPARRRGLQIQALQANAGPLRTAPQARPGPPVLSLAEYV